MNWIEIMIKRGVAALKKDTNWSKGLRAGRMYEEIVKDHETKF